MICAAKAPFTKKAPTYACHHKEKHHDNARRPRARVGIESLVQRRR